MTSTLNMKIYVKEILQIMNLFYFCSFHSSYIPYIYIYIYIYTPFLYPSYTLPLKVTFTKSLEQSFTTPLSYYNQFTSD